LVALAPDVILVNGPADLAQVQQATRSLLQDPTLTFSVAQFAAIQSAAASSPPWCRWLPSAPAAVNDGLAARVQSCRAHNFLDTVSRDKIFGIVVSQNPGRVANVDGTGDMSTGVGIGRAYVPHKHVARDSISDILVIDDDRRSSQCSVAPEEKQRYGDHAHHHKTPVSWLSWRSEGKQTRIPE
jgi:hypothetical protein